MKSNSTALQTLLSAPRRVWLSIDRAIDQTGMYRIVTLGLLFLVACSLTWAVFGVGAYTLTEQLLSLAAVTISSLVVNVLISKLTGIHANHESALITALILFFLFPPAFLLPDHMYIAAAGAIAMVSKYLLAWRKQHIFNAAALGAVALSLPYIYEAWWWVASPELFIPLLLVGAAVVQKVRRWPMVFTFLGVGLAVFSLDTGSLQSDTLWRFFVTGPSLFLAFFMLTEPFTTPPTHKLRLAYAALVAALMNTTLFAPYLAMTPELALVIGNLLFFPATLRQKLVLPFVERVQLAANTYEFMFAKPAGMNYQAGQYLEWMLPHEGSDSRGIRRYFTVASAPEEAVVRVALRIEENGSTYKQKLMNLQPGDSIIASQRAGDFLLQHDPHTKYAFIAGGIGVTPFRSFVGHWQAQQQTVDAVLFYGCNTEADIAYRDYFAAAEATSGLRTVTILSSEEKAGFEHGYFSAAIAERHTPDAVDRYWYISGPPVMVNACATTLQTMGVPRRQIITDFFPGLA